MRFVQRFSIMRLKLESYHVISSTSYKHDSVCVCVCVCERERERDESAEVTTETIIDRIMSARLSQRPKTLFNLWHEFQFGLDGYKLAKEFSRVERQKSKSVYCHRLLFLGVIEKLVNAGYTSEVAIDKVYKCHCTTSTKILLKMVIDRKSGGHPNLQVG